MPACRGRKMLSDPQEPELRNGIESFNVSAGNPSCVLWKGGVHSLNLLSSSLNFYYTFDSFLREHTHAIAHIWRSQDSLGRKSVSCLPPCVFLGLNSDYQAWCPYRSVISSSRKLVVFKMIFILCVYVCFCMRMHLCACVC